MVLATLGYGHGVAAFLLASLAIASPSSAALHYPDASATVDAAKVVPADVTKVEPFDGKKIVAAEEGHPLDAKS